MQHDRRRSQSRRRALSRLDFAKSVVEELAACVKCIGVDRHNFLRHIANTAPIVVELDMAVAQRPRAAMHQTNLPVTSRLGDGAPSASNEGPAAHMELR
jgi:hypothetical protein